MRQLVLSFTDELTKIAGPSRRVSETMKKNPFVRGVVGLVSDILDSSRYRHAILRAAALGGATGAVSGLMSKGDTAGSRTARSGAIGAVTGAMTGVAFPAGFTASSMRIK
jgi:hypothetical protein